MNSLRPYFNSLSRDERAMFCAACGTTEGYLRKAMCTGTIGPRLAANIDRHTNGAVTREELRPDIFRRDGNAA